MTLTLVGWRNIAISTSVCLSLRSHTSKTTLPNFTFSVYVTYYYYYYKICIAHKFKHARLGGAGWENGLAGEGK